MYIISKVIGINKGKEMYISDKEYISGHRCERTNISAKCKIFMNCSNNVIGICRKTNMTAKQGLLKGS